MPTITIDDLNAYPHRVLARDNLKVAIVGDIDAEAAKAMLDRVFGALPAKAELTPIGTSLRRVSAGALSSILTCRSRWSISAVPASRARIPDFFAAYIVNDILGGGTFSSRLYREVREKRGLAYSVYDSLVWLEHSRGVSRRHRDARRQHR